MDDPPTVVWIVLASAIIMACQLAYFQLMKLLLARIHVRIWHRYDMTKAAWQLGFVLISSFIILFLTNRSVKDLFMVPLEEVETLDYYLNKCKMHKNFKEPGLMSAFVLHFSYLTTQGMLGVYNKSYRRVEFLRMQLFLVILFLTNYSRCTLYGLYLMLLTHRCTLQEMLSKLCFLMYRHTNSTMLKIAARVFYTFHIILWLATFLLAMPIFLAMNKTINSTMLNADLQLLIVIHGMVCAFLVTTWIDAPFTRMMMSAFLPDQPGLVHFLFGADLERRRICCIYRQEARRPSSILFQTIRSSILLKRKAKKARERIALRKSLQEEAAAAAAAQALMAAQEDAQTPRASRRRSLRSRSLGRYSSKSSERQSGLSMADSSEDFMPHIKLPEHIKKPKTKPKPRSLSPRYDFSKYASKFSSIPLQQSSSHLFSPPGSSQDTTLPRDTPTNSTLDSDLSRESVMYTNSPMLRRRRSASQKSASSLTQPKPRTSSSKTNLPSEK